MNPNKKGLGHFLSKKKIYIVLIGLVIAFTGVSYTLTNVKFVSHQKILIGQEDRIETYKEIIKGSTVLEKVINRLNLDTSIQDLSNMIDVKTNKDTKMLEIQISGEENFVNYISEEVSKDFVEIANNIYENPDIYIVDSSSFYEYKENIIIIGIELFIVGVILAYLLFIIVYLLDKKIKSCKDIEEITGLKSLISIPNIKHIKKKKLNIKNIRAHKSEIFKLLMTNIQFVNSDNLESKSIVITSPKSLDGKTYVATNLAIEFAKAGKKVILIDGDMRKGRISKIFNLPNNFGFSNYLANLDSNGNNINERITRFIYDTEIKNLNVITSGNIPPNPVELLKANKVRELIKELKIFYDVILFDSVSLLEAQESIQLSKVCDLSFILSSYGKTKKEELRVAYNIINRYDECCIGVGFNKVPDRKLRRIVANYKSDFKRKISKISTLFIKILKEILNIFKQIFKIFKIFSIIFYVFISIVSKIEKTIKNFFYGLKTKSQDVKYYMQKYKNKKDNVKLIDVGIIPNYEQNDIVMDTFEFEYEIGKIEYNKENDNNKKKIDIDKDNKKVKEENPSTVTIDKPKAKRQEKSKFDLIREQQRKGKMENQLEIEWEGINTDKGEFEQASLVVSKLEKSEQEEENTIIEVKKEEPVNKNEQNNEHIEFDNQIDFSKQEYITEEMIRRQVEIDEMIRLAKKEQEETIKIREMKQEERYDRNKEYKERTKKIFDSSKNKKEKLEKEQNLKKKIKVKEKLQKEKEKLENKVKIAKMREEKKANRDRIKKIQKEEAKIKEDLMENNLYPKPRM